MTFSDLACRLIIGYDLLPLSIRTEFERSEVAQHFVRAVRGAEVSIKQINQQSSRWSRFVGTTQQQIDTVVEQLSAKALNHELLVSSEYQNLISKIVLIVLPRAYPDIELLDPEQKQLVADAEFSKILQSEFIQANKKYKEFKQQYNSAWSPSIEDGLEVDALKQARNAISEKWYQRFSTNEGMSNIRVTIGERKAARRAQQLANFFPFLNDPRWDHSTPPIDRLRQDYNDEVELAETESRALNLDNVDEEFLTNLLNTHLNAKTSQYINFIEVEEFNEEQANSLAKKILQAFNDGETLRMNEWLDDYQRELTEYIRKKISLVDGEEWEQSTIELSEAANALSFLWNNKASRWSSDFLNRIGDAYSFLQYMGATAQNDNFVFSIIDVYNLYRNADGLAETKSIFLSLFKPFLPLYQEYKEIARFEKSFFRKVFRTLMPLLIIAGFVVLVAALMSPLAIPELAFLIAAVPILFIGIALATQYVKWKNSISQYLRELYYGGPFETPEFTVNERMIHTFGSLDQAEVIRSIYIDEIQRCDENEAWFKENESHLEDPNQRKENLDRRYALLLEWYDIHSNYELGVGTVKAIVAKQLTQIANEEYESLKMNLEGDEGRAITRRTQELVDSLKSSLSPQAIALHPVPDIETGPLLRETSEPNTASRRQVSTRTEREQLVPEPVLRGMEIVGDRRELGVPPSVVVGSSVHPQRFFLPLTCLQQHDRVEKASRALAAIRHPIAAEVPIDDQDYERTVSLRGW